MAAPTPTLLERLRLDLGPMYRVESELGSGAAATVFRAFDLKHNRPVAIKVLRPELAATLTGERFLREINIAGQFQHPHILSMLDSGMAAGSYYFVMPLVEGESLRQRLRHGLPLTEGDAVRILLDVADALSYAHQHGVVHRDIKPDNIMLTGRHAVVMDFGVAKALNQPSTDRHLTTGVALGTPAYMAPEQATASEEIDHRADIYALGVVGYEMLAGRPPFTGPTPQDVLTAHVVLTPEPLQSRRADVSRPLAETIERCLAKRPEDRWQSAAALAERLDGFVTSTGGIPPTTAGKPRRLAPVVAAMVGVVAIAMVSWDLRVRQAAEEPAVGRPERLSFLGNVREASLSPDGSLLAYVTADPDGYHLWVEDAPGAGRPIPLATSERIVGIAWTSGGTQISYAEGPADRPVIRMISRLGGNGVIVGTGRGILSPDGKLVVVATGGDPNVMVVRRAENDTTRLRRPGEGWLNGIAWAPTSDRLVLAIMASDKSSTAISTLGLDGSVKPLLVETRPAYGPIWTPNGQSIYYVATTGSGRDVMRLPVTGGPPTTVAADIAVSDESRRYPTGTFLSIDANEERAVFVEEEQWSNLARFALDVNGGPTKPQPTLFTMGTALYSAARLSPDATQLAVFVSTSRGKKLGTVAIDGNQVEDIAVVGMNGQPAWSPDGSMIAYTGRVGTAGVTLAVYERASGVTRRPNDPTGLELTWAGSDIIVQRPGNHGLNAIDPSALTMTPLAPHDPLTTTFSPRAAPNGNLIAMTVSASGNGPVSFAVLDRATGATRVLLNGAYRPVGWSPDSKTVYAVTNPFAPAPEELLAVPLNGQPPRRIATLPPGYYSEDLSPDGRLLIASQVQTQSDTWQIRLKPAR